MAGGADHATSIGAKGHAAVSLHAFALEETEIMTKRITAERSGPMRRILEDLFAPGIKLLDSLKGSVQVFYMEVEMHIALRRIVMRLRLPQAHWWRQVPEWVGHPV